MSTTHITYVGYGVMTQHPDEYDDEALHRYRDSHHDEHIGQHDGVTAILDGYSGKFAFVGHVIAKSSLYEPLRNVAIPHSLPSGINEAIDRALVEIGVTGEPENLTRGWHVVTDWG